MGQSQNIAIIGAGIMGLSAAYALSKAEHKITLYDPKGFPADNAGPNASRVAGGMLAPYAETEHMPEPWIKAGLEGIRLWQERMPEHVTQNGSLLIAHKEDQYILERFKAHLPSPQMVQTEDFEPQLGNRFPSALHLPEEAHLNPESTLRKMHEILKEKGVTFVQDEGETDASFDCIIDCRGMGAAQDDPGLRGVKGEILIVRNTEFSLSRPVRLMHPRYPLYIVPRDNHIFMIGATQIESADETIMLRSGLELMNALYSLHPSFGEAEILEIKAGIRPAYPNNLPRITIQNNIIRCNGLFRHGFLLAPVMAACVADYTAGKDNEFMNLFTGEADEHHHQRRREKLRSAA